MTHVKFHCLHSLPPTDRHYNSRTDVCLLYIPNRFPAQTGTGWTKKELYSPAKLWGPSILTPHNGHRGENGWSVRLTILVSRFLTVWCSGTWKILSTQPYGDKERFMTAGRKTVSTAMVIRRFLTTNARVRSQGSPSGIRGGQSNSGESCFSLLIGLPMPNTTPPIFQVHSYIIQGNECVRF
jgi:hypothetical protein